MLTVLALGPRLALRAFARAVLLVPVVAREWERAKAGAAMTDETFEAILEAIREDGPRYRPGALPD